jgi:chorismate mutase
MNSEQQRTGGGQETAAASHEASAVTARNDEDAQRTLEVLRDELDGLDKALLETLRRRLDCCCRIGLHKRNHAIPMMQPHRIGVVQARAAAFAAAHGMNPDFLRSFYELIITETCRLEDEIIGLPSTPS